MIAILLLMMAVVLTGCGDKAGGDTVTDNGSSTGSGNRGAAYSGNWVNSQNRANCTITITFRADYSWLQQISGTMYGVQANFISFQGTYTGNPAQSGTLSLIVTHMADFETFSDTQNITSITNAIAPLVEIPAAQRQPVTATVSGNQLTLSQRNLCPIPLTLVGSTSGGGTHHGGNGGGNNGNGNSGTALPPNVGTDPFKGNTYSCDYDPYIYIFKDDGTLEEWWRESNSSDYRLYCVFIYTYNANTKVLAMKSYRQQIMPGTNLMTLDESIDWINGMTDAEVAQMSGGLTKDDLIDMLNAYYNSISLYKAEEEMHDGALRLYKREYYPENTSISELNGSDYLDFTSTGFEISIQGENIRSSDGGNSITFAGNQRYSIIQITDSTITATSDNDSSTLTLNYTKTWEDGVITLNVSGADEASRAVLGNQSHDLSTPTRKLYYTKITTNNGNNGNTGTPLPPNVGTDTFKGNTYFNERDGGSMLVFKSDGTIEEYSSLDGGQTYDTLRFVYIYTYNANTQFLSYKWLRTPSPVENSSWSLDDYLSWLNGLTDLEIQQMLNMTRTEAIELLNSQYTTIYQWKLEEYSENGVQCFSRRDYYDEDTVFQIESFTINNGNIDLNTIVLSADGERIIGTFFRSSCYSSTNYSMTDMTDSTFTATSEDGNSIITFNYTITWNDGSYTFVITGVDDVAQAIIGETPFTNTTLYLRNYTKVTP